ncbi:glycosyltransferase family 9 protein [Rapidithrix thailandica]|uniref:Glycosyltransferase family 9 protein n=1 Tax=Rapidithrix thailandica TaxID=413964 RepID=A0AAW9S6U7_9BACT
MKRWIISRTDHLNGVIVTLPLAGYLKSVYPDLHISFIGRAYARDIVERCKHIDQFIDREQVLKQPETLSSLDADAIVFLFPDKELAKVAHKAKIPQRVGTSSPFFQWRYCNKRVKVSAKHISEHEAQRNFKLLAPLGVEHTPTLEELPSYFGLEADPEAPKSFTRYLKKDLFNLILHPKSSDSAHNWPLEQYFALLEALPRYRFQVLVVGSEAEGELLKQKMPSIFYLPYVTNLTGKLNLTDLLGLIDAADGVIASNTGPLHLAAALGKQTLGLYAPAQNMHPERWAPLGEKAECLWKEKDCDACKKSLKCSCIQSIPVEEVLDKVKAFEK